MSEPDPMPRTPQIAIFRPAVCRECVFWVPAPAPSRIASELYGPGSFGGTCCVEPVKVARGGDDPACRYGEKR